MRYAAVILFTWACGLAVKAQPMAFTQYFMHRQWDNPAAMGAEVRTAAAFAGQYCLYGFENAPMSGALQVTVPFGADGNSGGARSLGSYYNDGIYSRSNTYGGGDESAKLMSWGITLKMAAMGAQQRYEALAAYSYQIGLAASSLSFGIGLGASVKSNNYASLTDEYSIDPLQNSASNAVWALAAQTGVYWYNDKFYASLYSPAVTGGDVFAQIGYGIAFGGSENDGYDSPAKKNRWEMHLQGGRLGTGGWQAQAATIFTLKGLLGIGFAWQRPLNLAALAMLNIGGIQIGYSYGIFEMNQNLLQHEISVKIRFAGKKEMD